MVGLFLRLNFICLAFMLFPIPKTDAGQNQISGCLIVDIENPSDRSGSVRVCVFSSSAGFPDDPRQATACITAERTEGLSVRFEDVPFGTLAVSAYQDWNNNGRLDKGWLGIPKEPVGVSNGDRIKAERPRFDTSSFRFDQTELRIRIPLRVRTGK